MILLVSYTAKKIKFACQRDQVKALNPKQYCIVAGFYTIKIGKLEESRINNTKMLFMEILIVLRCHDNGKKSQDQIMNTFYF